MKIHFCDLCNESVPQSDIDEGRARMRKGRVVCPSCERAMSHTSAEPHEGAAAPVATAVASAALAPADDAAPQVAPVIPSHATPALRSERHAERSSSAGLWFAILGIVFTAGAIAVMNRAIEGVSMENRRLAALLTEKNQAIHGLTNRADEFERAQQDQAEHARGDIAGLMSVLDSARQSAEADQAARRIEDAALSQSIADLRAELTAWREDVDRRLVALSTRVGRNEDDQQLLVERFSALESGPMLPTAAPVSAGPAAGAAPQWGALVADLTSPNAGIRWQAVVSLGDTKDASVVPSLLPMLADKDVFVRMATARVLGELGQNTAVPALIDALEDAEAPVREAASIALRALTGKDLRFDPLGNEADRAKKVKAWREWWKKLQEDPASVPG